MNLEKNFFILMNLPQQFDVDLPALKRRGRELMRQYHPDRYINATPQEQRLAVQFSSHVNTAIATLQNPILRAMHLCEIDGIRLDNQRATVSDISFLTQQIELREQIESAVEEHNNRHLEHLLHQVMESAEVCYAVFRDEKLDKETRVETIGKMQFYEKLENEIRLALES